jgi:hypothetical protein
LHESILSDFVSAGKLTNSGFAKMSCVVFTPGGLVMNALPVEPQYVADADQRTRYFDDLEKWDFEIAYSTLGDLPYNELIDSLREVYTAFVTEAHKRGYPACMQFLSTFCADDRISMEEAQYDADNNPIKSKKGFCASYASDAWKDHLKELTTLFVRQYGFDYVVFEEPVFKADIPGNKDRFYNVFVSEFSNMKYPERCEESTAYLTLQNFKAQMIEEFYADLIEHAKSVGAKKTGILSSSFIPTISNASRYAYNISRISRIPGLDFIMARIEPSDISEGKACVDDEISKSPGLAYIDVMADALGKDVIVLSDPKDSKADFYKDVTLSSLAADPCGFAQFWHGDISGKDDTYMDILSSAAKYANRLGKPQSPVAFVFSHSGMRHVDPLTYDKVFSHYWTLAKELAFNAHIPMLTFHADTLDKDLKDHPEVQLLVFEEHFPLTMEQMLVIRNWWQSSQKRAAIAFGSGKGYNADPVFPGLGPCAASFPGILELIGLRQEEGLTLESDGGIELKDVSRVRRSAFLEDATKVKKIADVRRIFGSRASILYEAEINQNKIPVVAEWRDRSTLAIFCGFGLSADTASISSKAVSYALREVNASDLMIDSCSDGVFWSINAHDYVVLSSISDKEGSATARPGRANLWDVINQKMLPDGDPKITLAPHSFGLYRVVGRRSKFYDVQGIQCIRRLTDGAGRAEIEVLAGQKTVFVLRNSPKEIFVDGKSCTVSQEIVDGVYYVTLLQCNPGERIISLRW